MTDPTAGVVLPRRLAERFSLLSLVGRGGFGLVLKARQVDLDRVVALKVLLPELAADPGVQRRFLQEARLASALQHESIVPVLDHGVEEGMLYIAFPFIEGRSLRAVLGDGALPSEAARSLGLNIAGALEAIHAATILHRDLKPENVLLDGGRALVTDFGISKPQAATFETEAGLILGSPGYLAPELVAGQNHTVRSDLYALGVILWEMLVGRRPFQRPGEAPDRSELVAELARSTAEEAPPLPDAIGAPPRLRKLVAALLARAPDERPDRAATVVAALTGSSGETRESTVRDDGTRPRARSRSMPVATLPATEATRPPSTGPGRPIETRLTGPPARDARNLRSLGFLLVVGTLGVIAGVVSRPAAPPSPSTPALPARSTSPSLHPGRTATGAAAVVEHLRERAENSTMALRPWQSADARGLECPWVLTCKGSLEHVTLAAQEGRLITGVNGTPVRPERRSVTLRTDYPALVEGLNWVGVTGQPSKRHVVRVEMSRRPCPDTIGERVSLEGARVHESVERALLHSALSDADSADIVSDDQALDAAEAIIAAEYPASDEPRRKAWQNVLWLRTQVSLDFPEVGDAGMTLVEAAYPTCYSAFWEDLQGPARDAIRSVQSVLAKDPRSWIAWTQLGWVLSGAAHADSARCAIVRSLELRPECHWTWLVLFWLEHDQWLRRRARSEWDTGPAETPRMAARRALRLAKDAVVRHPGTLTPQEVAVVLRRMANYEACLDERPVHRGKRPARKGARR